MPILGGSTIVSDEFTYIAGDQLTAIDLAINNDPGNKATVLPTFVGWPSIMPYSNYSNNKPSFIWDSVTTDSQSRGFAKMSGSFKHDEFSTQAILWMAVFTDNAHVARVDVYNTEDSANPIYVETISPVVLQDGSMDPNTGLTEVQPYNWQTVRVFQGASSLLQSNTFHSIVVSFTAVNYTGATPPATPGNVAGLMFYAQVSFTT